MNFNDRRLQIKDLPTICKMAMGKGVRRFAYLFEHSAEIGVKISTLPPI